MLSLTAGQQAIVDSPVKSVSWLFDVVDKDLTSYNWSTKTLTVGATPYTFRVINFSGVTLARPRTESGLMPPSELTFTVINKGNILSADDFDGGYVTLRLYMGNGTDAEVEIRAWKFLIKKVEGAYQQLDFTCEDFLQQYIEGDYPGSQYVIEDLEVSWEVGTEWEAGTDWGAPTTGAGATFAVKVRDIFPAPLGDIADDACVPLSFGVAYVPIRSAYIVDDRFYVIGPTIANGAAVTYTISAVRTPREYSTPTEYLSPTYAFNQYTKVNSDGLTFRTFQAMIAAGPANGLFENGDQYYDLPTEFSRSDTATVTNPADVIEYVLKHMGVEAADIDATTFAAAAATYDTWGLSFNGAFWRMVTREKALTLLLAMCHSTLIPGEKLELHVLDASSKKTIATQDVMKSGDTGIGTFRHASLARILADCGNVSYSPTGDAQDLGISALVAAKVSRMHVDPEVFYAPFIQEPTIATQIARLYFQRKLLKKSEERLTAKGTCVALQPGDFVTVDGSNYGGAHDVIIDSMTINKDVSIDMVCTGFTDAVDNYAVTDDGLVTPAVGRATFVGIAPTVQEA